jgi:rhamnose transport system substrate-binding protein
MAVPMTILLVSSLLLAACGQPAAQPTATPSAPEGGAATPTSGASTSGGQQGKQYRIAFIPQLIGIPYFTAMEQGGKEAAAKFGGEFLYVGATTASAPEQVRLMENLISQKVDAISISVLDSKSINPVIKKAREAGIHVFTSDSDSPDSEREVYVAQALDDELGYTLIDHLAAQIGNKGEIGIVSGESTATNLNTWIDYMKKRVADKYPDIKIVDVRYTTGGSSEDALRQAQELMTRYPDIKGLVAVASTTVPGVAQAVQQAGKAGQIAVIGYGSPNTVRPFIKSGVMKESILWNPRDLGYLTHWAGLQLVQGKPFQETNEVPGLKDPIKYFPDKKILLLGPPLVINADNVDQFDF